MASHRLNPVVSACLMAASVLACERPAEREAPAVAGEDEQVSPAMSAAAAPGPTRLSDNAFKVAFHGEPRDGSWAGDMEAHVTATMREFPDSWLASVECKTTVCKIVASHQSAREQVTWQRMFIYRLAANPPERDGRLRWAHTAEVDESMTNTTLYLTRPGYVEPERDGTPRKAPARGALVAPTEQPSTE